jgi:O-antigen ligase
VFLLSFQNPILNLLESNRQDSSDNLIEHVTSLSNISTDASNMERINRWKCALKMFVEKPFFGWGPGTYQFQYARFQVSSDRTIISSNMGDMGNAHSEYLGPLSESGFFGFLSFLILMALTIIYAINMYYKSNDSARRTWLLAIIVALLSYAIHGLFNNFLDTDKASVAIWGVVAIIVGLDLFKDEKQSQSTVIS